MPELRRLVRSGRGTAALEALWTANLIAGLDAGWALELLDHPDAAIRLWTVRLREGSSIAPPMRDRLVRLARTEPSAEVRSELAAATARFEAGAALAVLGALVERPEDVSDRYIPLRIWWALEEVMTSDADAVLTWLEKAGAWHHPLFSEHLAGRVARRLAADRGDTQSYARIDPDRNWKQYAQHPRSQMPGGKGDYTDWETNYTREISDRNLTRLARLLRMAPAAQRDRLLAGVKAGLRQGVPAEQVPERLLALICTATLAGRPAAADDERGRDAFVTHCAPCHQTDGSGMQRLATPLRNSKWVLGDEDPLIRIVLNGLRRELLMPAMGTLDDQQLAAILTYIRRAWGHEAGPISPDTVARVRAASSNRTAPWTVNELSAAAVRRP